MKHRWERAFNHLSKPFYFFFYLATALLFTNPLSAQQQTVTGTVVSGTDNKPLSGATVEVRGSANGTTTDQSGRFSISANRGATLVFGYVGFASQEIAVRDSTTMNVTLQGANASLNEVVVIGYQAVRKKDLTGSTGVVDMTQASRVTAGSVGEQIQGLVPGVTVRNTGSPGANATVEIRGASSFGSTNPLYVIDGMLADANTTINPDDVASIQILKDASAAAIYGSRAGNGVIIITTKKGREGPAKISVSAKAGMQQIPKRWDVMDAAQYLQTVQTQYKNSNTALPTGIAAQVASPTLRTNWQDEIYRTGHDQDYNLGISGGSQTASFFVSGNYYKNQGVLVANNFERASLRINTEAKKGRLTVGENMVLSNTYGSRPGGGINAFYEAPLMLPIIGVQGNQYKSIPANPAGWGMGTSDVPSYSNNYLAVASLDRQTYNYAKVVGNVYADFKFTNWLSYRFNAGVEASFDYYKELRDTGIWRYANQPPQTSVSEDREKFTNFLLEHTLNFNKTFSKHSINGVVGFSRTQQRRDITTASRLNLTNAGGTQFTTINSATGSPSASGTTPVFWRSHGYLGRINYTYNDRYLLTLTGRIDQDSRFGPNYHTGYFPSAAAGWRISREDFFKVDWINDLKLRGSYGKLGFSDVLGSYDYQAVINTAPRAIYGVGQTPQNGAYQAIIINPDLHWETRVQKNVGFDASVLNNRVLISADVYQTRSKDVLVTNLPVAYYLGTNATPGINAASIKNSGIELSATYRNNGNPFKWDVSANLTTIRNRVTAVGNAGVDASGTKVDYLEVNGLSFIRAQVGHAIGEWYVIKTDGIFNSQAEINAYTNKAGKVIQPNAKPGDIRYADANGDGQINNSDRQYAGSPWPTLQAGAQFNASYKQFTFNVQLVGVFGSTIYNDIRRSLDSYQLTNFRKDVSPWTTSNQHTSDPRLAVDQPNDPTVSFNNQAQTDRWLENGSYVRIRNVEIGYSFSKSLLNRVQFSNARIYVSGQNLLTFTKYTGLDPDVQGTGIISRGFDAGNWPPSRIISAGLMCDF
ncbi:MAG: TonB-dependent receptor [Williamsia sp.]|nr:TonB-dependent receptor [Williamsia sp.]